VVASRDPCSQAPACVLWRRNLCACYGHGGLLLGMRRGACSFAFAADAGLSLHTLPVFSEHSDGLLPDTVMVFRQTL